MATNYAKNLGSGTLASAISASSTSLSVYVGEGSSSTIQGVWPSVPFYATIMPATPSAGVPNSLDSEVVKVTAVGSSGSNTTLTVTRAQRGTTAKAFSEGAIVTNADYAEDAVLLSDEGTSETDTAWIEGNDISDGAITTGKLANSAVTSAKLADGSVVTGKLGGSSVTTAKLADSSVTSDKLASSSVKFLKIDRSEIDVPKLLYSYRHTGDPSGALNLDIPIYPDNALQYKKLIIEGYFTATTNDTIRVSVHNTSSNVIKCYEYGWEFWGGSNAVINREMNEMNAFTVGDSSQPYYVPASVKIEIFLDDAIKDNYPTFHGESCGGPLGRDPYLQHFVGRILQATGNIQFIRLGTFHGLRSGSWLKMSGIRSA